MARIILRYGELALKGGNRVEFVRRLRRNVRAALKAEGLTGEVHSAGQRVYVETDDTEAALDPLGRVFGLVSLSPVVRVPREMDAIAAECARQAEQMGLGPETSFRVRARRTDKAFPHISPEIDRLAGEAVVRATNARVDLSKGADVTLGVEVTREGAMVYGRTIAAPGGLPVGTEGKVVVLLSGGIDSPVAAWMMLKRGCGIVPLHFSQNEVETAKAMDNVEALARHAYGWRLRPVVVSHDETIVPTLDALQRLGESRWSCVFCKRALLTRATALADELEANAIVLGDSLGQVASQTLANIELISYGIKKPILRPLIGLDKTEIVDIARRVGTFDISTRDAESCPYLPNRPITRGRMEKLLEIMERLRQEEGIET